MTIYEAMIETVKMSKGSNQLVYLAKDKKGNWIWSKLYDKNWLFKAYPGGRKQLSLAGKEIVDNEL